ncbi:hypothetical protein C8F00_1892 [Xanthomonas vasicola]
MPPDSLAAHCIRQTIGMRAQPMRGVHKVLPTPTHVTP